MHQHLRLNAATTCSARRDCRRDCRSCCRSHCKSTPCSLPLFPRVHWPWGTRTDTHGKCPVIRANNVRQTPPRMPQLPKHRLHDMFCAREITITAKHAYTADSSLCHCLPHPLNTLARDDGDKIKRNHLTGV